MDAFASKPKKRVRGCEDGDGERGSLRKKMKVSEEEERSSIAAEFSNPLPWQKIEAEGLDCDYALLFSRQKADELFKQLEEEVDYFTGEKAKVHVFGKLRDVPRKQATYGDPGLMYSFSGVHHLARPWTPTLEHIRDAVTKATGYTFNFVLVNRNTGPVKEFFLIVYFVMLLGIKMGEIILVNIEMMRRSWTTAAPLPLCLWGQPETLCCVTESHVARGRSARLTR